MNTHPPTPIYPTHTCTRTHIHIHTHIHSQLGSKLKYIKQRKFYSSDSNRDTGKENSTLQKSTSNLSKYHSEDGAKDSLKSTRMPKSVLEPVLHGRSVARNDFSELAKQMDATSSSECKLKTLVATEPIAQSQFSQQLPEESCHSILTGPNPMEQNTVQSPLMSSSHIGSSPTSSTVMVSPQKDFFSNPELLLDFISPVEMCPPYNSAASTSANFSPPSAYPADVNMVPQPATDANSIPFTPSVPFPCSQIPNFIPQAPSSTAFYPQIAFNFLSNSHPYPQNLDTAPRLDIQSMQVLDSSNPPLNDSVSDSFVQQIVDEMVDESNFNPIAYVSDHNMTTSSAISSSHSQASSNTHVLHSSSLLSAGSYHPRSLLNAIDLDQGDCLENFPDSQTNAPDSGSSNREIQDILQQFM